MLGIGTGGAGGTAGTIQASIFQGTSSTAFTVGNISGTQRILYNNANSGFEYELLNSGNGIAGIQIAQIDAFELSGGTSAAGHARLWADSTSHFWKANNNAGSSYNLVGDTTTQTLTNKTLTSPSVTSPTINTGLSQGSGVKHQRFGATCAPAAVVGASCTTTYSWSAAFADANYTVTCTPVQASFSVTASVQLTTVTATGFTISVVNNTGNPGLSYSGVNCTAMHD